MARPRTQPRSHGSRYVRCAVCSKTITLNNFSTHLKNKHPERQGQPRPSLYEELDGPSQALAVVERKPPPALPPLDLDDVVIAVVGQLAEPGGAVPVDLLPALFAWRSATALFLSTVEQHRAR